MKVLVRLAAVVALTIAAGAPAAGADTGWTIEAFRSDIAVRSTGELAITETIDVDFGALAKHGIFRTIPTRYRYDDRRDRTYGLVVASVSDRDGRPLPFQVTKDEIRIGDPGRTVSGAQSYRIAYTVRGALNAFSDHDELFWNVNGPEWGVPTRAARATVVAPRGSVVQAGCFEGSGGATAPCRLSSTADGASFDATRALAPGEQLTIVVGLRSGAVAVEGPFLVYRPRGIADYFSTTPAALVVAAAALGGGLLGVWRLWWTRGRDRGPARGAIVPEYEPPDGLGPAQLGVLVDETADPRDLVATIVDLAVRGYLAITEHAKHGLFARTDWTLDKKKGGEDLLPYERRLLEGLFASGDSVLLSTLRGTFAPALKAAERLLYSDATARRWFVADPSKVRLAYAATGCLVSVAGVGLVFALGATFGFGLVGLAVVPVGLALVLLNRAMPARTAPGAALLARTLGFRRYMDTAEKDRAAFAEKEGLFTAYLPYAVMFGCVDGWTRAFAGLDVSAAVSGWYVGPGAFQPATFASGFGGFASTLSTTVAATPGGSGGSGFSGGSAGGGGGGGGGGSW